MRYVCVGKNTEHYTFVRKVTWRTRKREIWACVLFCLFRNKLHSFVCDYKNCLVRSTSLLDSTTVCECTEWVYWTNPFHFIPTKIRKYRVVQISPCGVALKSENTKVLYPLNYWQLLFVVVSSVAVVSARDRCVFRVYFSVFSITMYFRFANNFPMRKSVRIQFFFVDFLFYFFSLFHLFYFSNIFFLRCVCVRSFVHAEWVWVKKKYWRNENNQMLRMANPRKHLTVYNNNNENWNKNNNTSDGNNDRVYNIFYASFESFKFIFIFSVYFFPSLLLPFSFEVQHWVSVCAQAIFL